MADKTLASLTAATTDTGGLFYGTQSGADKKFTLTAAGASLIEAADAVAQRTALFAGYSLTGSQATSLLDLGGTWNTTGVATAFKLNITNTASGAGSLLFDVQADSKSVFNVSPTEVTIGRYDSFGVGTYDIHWNGRYGLGVWIQNGNNSWRLANGLGTGGGFLSIDAGGANTVYLRNYSSPNILQLGNDSGDTPTAQRIKAHDVTTGTGADLELAGGTGSVANGTVKIIDGKLNVAGIPTSSVGLVTGDIYSNAGILTVV